MQPQSHACAVQRLKYNSNSTQTDVPALIHIQWHAACAGTNGGSGMGTQRLAHTQALAGEPTQCTARKPEMREDITHQCSHPDRPSVAQHIPTVDSPFPAGATEQLQQLYGEPAGDVTDTTRRRACICDTVSIQARPSTSVGVRPVDDPVLMLLFALIAAPKAA